MPEPARGESREDFLDRCMGDAEAVGDFPDGAQRFAFCRSQWDRVGKQAVRTGPGPDGHTHAIEPGDAYTSTDHGHRHEVAPGASRTEVADGHDHAIPTEGRVRARYPDVVRVDVEFSCDVEKVDADQRLVSGWFSVIEKDEDGTVFDRQGDAITERELVETAHRFVSDSRAGKAMHKGRRVADVVESVVFTRDLQKALGIDLGRVGWFATMKVRDDGVWKRVKSGELRAFSIGGTGRRREV